MQLQFSIILLFLALLPLLAAAGGEQLEKPNAWQPLKDLSSPYVKGIANFAVTSYNQKAKVSLKLTTIKSGETAKVAGGLVYGLTISTTDGSVSKDYFAVVFDGVKLHNRKLDSFVPVGH